MTPRRGGLYPRPATLPSVRNCPDCLTPLEDFARANATLGRCPCGGLWLPHGELEAFLGPAFVSEPLEGDTTRRCPDCTLSLSAAILPNGVPVEVCSTCRGTWVEWVDLVELKHKALSSLARPANPHAGLAAPEAPAPRQAGGFACAKCGQQRPFARGHGTASGLVCDDCVPQIQPAPRIPTWLAEVLEPDDDD